MSIQSKTMTVKSDTSLAETTTTIRDTVTLDVSKMPNGITYRGLKAVLSFADPIQWNRASTYDALTVVWDDASHGSYASKRRVPANIELSNGFYWLRTADLDAQVEMYRQEVRELDGRVTANTESIAANSAAIAANSAAVAAEAARAKDAERALGADLDSNYAKDCAFIIGNSYTAGYADHVRPNTIAGIAGKIFRKAFVLGASAAGFLPYTDHGTTFKSLLNTLIANNHDELGNITHVIFNSAIGDTAAYMELNDFNAFKKQYTAALTEIIAIISANLPNVRYIGVCMMESMQFSNRTFGSNVETSNKLLDTYFTMKGLTEKFKGVTWMGFPGWNLMGSFAMSNSDNTHPSPTGYLYLTNEWVNALNGTLEYLCSASRIDLDLSKVWNGVKGAAFISSYPDHSHVRVELEVTDGTLKTTNPQTVALSNKGILSSRRTFTLTNGLKFWARFDTDGNIKLDMQGVTLNNSISFEFDTEYLTYPQSVYY